MLSLFVKKIKIVRDTYTDTGPFALALGGGCLKFKQLGITLVAHSMSLLPGTQCSSAATAPRCLLKVHFVITYRMTNKPRAGRENVGHVGHVVISFKLVANRPGREGFSLNVGHVGHYFLHDLHDRQNGFFSWGAMAAPGKM
jgi:hypothetical protein